MQVVVKAVHHGLEVIKKKPFPGSRTTVITRNILRFLYWKQK